MSKKSIGIIFSIISLFAGSGLYADTSVEVSPKKSAEYSFYKGIFIIRMDGGFGQPYGSAFDEHANKSQYKFETVSNLNSTNAERQLLGLFQQKNTHSPTRSSNNINLGVEYGVGDIFGIGLSMSHFQTQVRPVYTTKLDTFGDLAYLAALSDDVNIRSFCHPTFCPNVPFTGNSSIRISIV